MTAASLGGTIAALGGNAPARAATGWGPGPSSGLPFWFGGDSRIDELVQMMPTGRSLDVVNLWETEGHYLETATKRPGGWARTKQHGYLTSGRAKAVQWSSSPFCSGSSFVVPTSWPSSASAVTASTHLNCCRPPTYTGGESTSERVAKQRRVWQIAADGWLDPVWREKMRLFKRDYFIKPWPTSSTRRRNGETAPTAVPTA
jgi:hypothetical protein